MTATPGGSAPSRPDTWGREHVANLYSLSVLSMIMNAREDEEEILRLAMTSVGALGPCRAEAGVAVLGEAPVYPSPDGHGVDGLADQLRLLCGREGQVRVPGREWGRAVPLQHTRGGAGGYLVVSATAPPGDGDVFLIHVLAQQTAAALALAGARRLDRDRARELRQLNEDRAAVNTRLATSVATLEHQRSVHEVLAQAAAAGGGVAGIATAVHRLTSRPVAVEDRFGNLRAWAGPERPTRYPKPDATRHEELLQEAARRAHPVRVGKRLIAPATHRGEVLGALALIDPDGSAGDDEVFVLDHACATLAVELAHVRSLAEVELRLRRELVDDLITGTDDESAYARAAAVGHDLHGAHHLAVAQWSDRVADDTFMQAVGRAAAGLRTRSLVARRPGMAVLVCEGPPRGNALYQALVRELGSPDGAIGVSGRCDTPGGIPRAHREALRALEVRRRSRTPHGATTFDDLGLYRLLGPGSDHREIQRFVRVWLGPLLDYDAAHHADLTQTLSQYFECGGNYDATAAALGIHRSTLRYRLRRIRDVSGSDLANVDNRLNLHVATRVWKVLDGAS
ncbi:PucR family transcriptional regulator [Streptomyces coffeae]|uniref:Helix-turn-helix domain-containing protein n=1 Tax=Streptomyces coffeae TaxID=621382 RepID=A0ABS1NBT1_9ACTN|nr:helix-turn-helix domain-containing protein [Streptomyces coffeae]MBL1097301.1 helix-turn-helix domain-containing protein [Streptomyces coffeae]